MLQRVVNPARLPAVVLLPSKLGLPIRVALPHRLHPRQGERALPSPARFPLPPAPGGGQVPVKPVGHLGRGYSWIPAGGEVQLSDAGFASSCCLGESCGWSKGQQ